MYVGEPTPNVNRICSGILASRPLLNPRRKTNVDQLPDHVKNKADVYASFRNVQFGPSFRNIQELRTWPTHADALITVEPTQYPTQDRIRKLDSCLHAFGAIVQEEVPQIHDLDGSFLPTSLNDFTLYPDDLPESFICRYYLPISITRNFHVMSAAFEVTSLSGELLASCEKYSVAWIPAGVAIQSKEKIAEHASGQWLQQSWTERRIPEQSGSSQTPSTQFDHLLYVGFHNSRLSRIISKCAHEIFSLYLPTEMAVDSIPSASEPYDLFSLKAQFDNVYQDLKSVDISILLDFTSFRVLPTSKAFTSAYRLVLGLMKLLSSYKVNIVNFVFVSEVEMWAIANNDIGHTSTPPSSCLPPSASSVVQGMLRVFRRETGLDTQVWALDLPSLDTTSDQVLSDILHHELDARRRVWTLDRTIAYRTGEDNVLKRLIPVLQRVDQSDYSHQVFTGTSIIVGLGSIGSALASALISKGSSNVVFIGRRHQEDSEIQEMLLNLQSETNGCCSYLQADAGDFTSLRSAMVDIQARYGTIENIIHAAAVIRDATIQNVDFKSFEEVLRPKVAGAWNLHLISEELCPSVKSFVLLSSISVSLGNQGQIAYVAGNSYMEALALYRKQRNLPATCLQLGAWESRLTRNMDLSNSLVLPMDNKTGIPLILKAMATLHTVQIIANLDVDLLSANPAYSQDPLFQDILPTVSSRETSTGRRHENLDVSGTLSNILRTVLELKPTEKLEPMDSLTSCGIDSISFAQIRGRVMNQLGVEVPMKYLSDSFTISEMTTHVEGSYNSLHARNESPR
ncbi:KR domain-containing protein [Flammula alnicola]|nr:KR domain-containing protein [Flammula alnicola]